MHVVYGILIGFGGVELYDLLSGYPVSDFLKDTYERLFGEAKSYVEARATRLQGKLAKVRAAL